MSLQVCFLALLYCCGLVVLCRVYHTYVELGLYHTGFQTGVRSGQRGVWAVWVRLGSGWGGGGVGQDLSEPTKVPEFAKKSSGRRALSHSQENWLGLGAWTMLHYDPYVCDVQAAARSVTTLDLDLGLPPNCTVLSRGFIVIPLL